MAEYPLASRSFRRHLLVRFEKQTAPLTIPLPALLPEFPKTNPVEGKYLVLAPKLSGSPLCGGRIWAGLGTPFPMPGVHWGTAEDQGSRAGGRNGSTVALQEPGITKPE